MSAQTFAENIVFNTSEPIRVIAPDPTQIFLRRAQRFEKLAVNHPLGDWLLFLAKLTHAQHEALQKFPQVMLAEPSSVKQRQGMPPLAATGWSRNAAWHGTALNLINVAEKSLPDAGRQQLRSLHEASPERLEALADQLLRGKPDAKQAAVLPIIAAALQVYWTHMAAALGSKCLPPLHDTPGICPCCGSLPVVSIVRTDGPVTGLRYLHCSLCNTEWNLVRVKCAACDSTAGIAYQRIEERNDPISAETCDSCHSYLKIAYAAQDADVDPVADDLATLSLDFLVDEAGYQRCGPNLLLVPGNVAPGNN